MLLNQDHNIHYSLSVSNQFASLSLIHWDGLAVFITLVIFCVSYLLYSLCLPIIIFSVFIYLPIIYPSFYFLSTIYNLIAKYLEPRRFEFWTYYNILFDLKTPWFLKIHKLFRREFYYLLFNFWYLCYLWH